MIESFIYFSLINEAMKIFIAHWIYLEILFQQVFIFCYLFSVCFKGGFISGFIDKTSSSVTSCTCKVAHKPRLTVHHDHTWRRHSRLKTMSSSLKLKNRSSRGYSNYIAVNHVHALRDYREHLTIYLIASYLLYS